MFLNQKDEPIKEAETPPEPEESTDLDEEDEEWSNVPATP